MNSGTWTDTSPTAPHPGPWGCCPWCNRPYDDTTATVESWQTWAGEVKQQVAAAERKDYVIVAWGVLGAVPVPNPRPPEELYISPDICPVERCVLVPDLPADSSRPDGAWP